MPFHAASVLEAALDLLEDKNGGTLQVESGGHLADYRRFDKNGGLSAVVRARSGCGSKVVSSDIWMAVRRWAAMGGSAASYVYRSEAALFPTAVTIVAERLDRFRSGAPTDSDLKTIRGIGVKPDSDCLRLIHLDTGCASLDLPYLKGRLEAYTQPLSEDDCGALVAGFIEGLGLGRGGFTVRSDAVSSTGRVEETGVGPVWSCEDLEQFLRETAVVGGR